MIAPASPKHSRTRDSKKGLPSEPETSPTKKQDGASHHKQKQTETDHHANAKDSSKVQSGDGYALIREHNKAQQSSSSSMSQGGGRHSRPSEAPPSDRNTSLPSPPTEVELRESASHAARNDNGSASASNLPEAPLPPPDSSPTRGSR